MQRRELIAALNDDLRRELQAVHAYLYQHAVVPGLHGQQVREMLSEEISDEIGHARFLSDAIVALGGEPEVEALDFKRETSIRQILEYDLTLEKEAIERYAQRAEQAREAGEVGLAIEIENIIADETRHKHTLERILRGLDA